MKSAHAYKETFERMGIDLRDLGCVMLETESPVEKLTGGTPYVSPDEKKFWIDGLLDDWHATVRYGFLEGVTAEDVDAVIADMGVPSELKLVGTEIFPSPYEDEKCSYLVARVDDKSLSDLNQALSVLPNVNTFPVYKAHITIGYFETDDMPSVLLKGAVKTTGLDYGHNLPRLRSL